MDALKIQKIGEAEIPAICDLAARIFPDNYAEILSAEQIAYMMEMMYAEDVLKKQLQKGVWFYLIEIQGEKVGYCAVEPHHKFPNDLYIHKIYLLPEMQGKGFGKTTMHEIENIGQNHKLLSISLNVNRFNKAKFFYEKVGFEVVKEEDIDIGNGYWMNDFVMRKEFFQ